MEKGLVGQLPNPSKYVVLGYVRWWNIPDSLTKPEIWFCKIKNYVMTGNTTWKQLGVHCNLEERLSPSNECIRLITLTYHYYTLHWKWSGWLKFHKPSKNNLLKRWQSWPDLKKKKNRSWAVRGGTHSRVFAAVALVLVFIIDVVAVAAGHHGQLRMNQGGFACIDLPERSMAVPHVVHQPCCCMAHFMNKCVP